MSLEVFLCIFLVLKGVKLRLKEIEMSIISICLFGLAPLVLPSFLGTTESHIYTLTFSESVNLPPASCLECNKGSLNREVSL